jgi:DNA-binding transcriptional ArsR family regulator
MSENDRRYRLLDDPRVMRAMAHPLRLQLLELIGLEGQLTATECAARVGESPAACSFHLRQLAKYGFLEEAGGGTGRQRPWRRTSLGHTWRGGPAAPAETRAAADVLSKLVRDRNLAMLEDYLSHADELGPDWADAAIHSDAGSWLTPDELREIGERIKALWEPYIERLSDPASRPEGAVPVQLLAFGFPRRDLAATEATGAREATEETTEGDDDA